ncbi:hypothetical protein BaRGS_00019284 [Batillaria attramentaria]|uniref:Exonuclease domain-containing protein n=1 Tax=Batillaria attramentaria TaxID=370345 RepID=A0ABD0KQT5_9CAEN
MFPTSGYFRAIGCPFYANGLCERPYCHFRHTKQDNEKAKDDVPSYSTAGVRSTSPVDTAAGTKPYSDQQGGSVDSYFTSIESQAAEASAPKSSTELLLAGIGQSYAIPSFTDSSTKYSIPTASEEPEQYLTASPQKENNRKEQQSSQSSKYPLPAENDDSPLPTYCPTPKTPSFPAASSSKLPSAVPAYQPTPKRELKRRNGDKRRIADMEYDPESNFSCGGLSKDHSANSESQDEDEPEPEPVEQKMEEGEDSSEDFDNIGDDDISSDDNDFVDVPSLPSNDSAGPSLVDKSKAKDSKGEAIRRSSDLLKGKREHSASKKEPSEKKSHGSGNSVPSASKTCKSSSSRKHLSDSKHSSPSKHSSGTSSSKTSSHTHKPNSSHESRNNSEKVAMRKKSKSDDLNQSGGFLGSVQTKLPEPKEMTSTKLGSEHKNGSIGSTKRKHSTDKSKSNKPDSSSHNLQRKQGHHKLERRTSGSDKVQVSRMNSDLFGDDSDGGSDDGGIHDLPPEPSTSAVESADRAPVDYSSFIHDSDFEDEDTFDECLRIFRENAQLGSVTQPEKKLIKDTKPKSEAVVEPNIGKKRVAHTATAGINGTGRAEQIKKERPRQHLSPAQVMHNRIMEMQRRALERATKQAVQEQEVGNLKRPVIPASFGSKVPSNIRQRYLNLIIDECLKFCSSEEAAYKKGLEEESGVYDRATNKNIYLRVAVNTITRLRSEAKESTHPSSSTSPPQRRQSLTQSHQATLGGSRAAKTSFTLHRSSGSGKKTEVALTAPELYQKLLKYCLTEEQLVENGYPRPSPDTPGKAVCFGTKYQQTDTLLKGNERTCSRCGKRFIVHADGTYLDQEECVYHWTRAYPRKKSGFIQHIYNCCNSDTSSKGCQVASNHVHEKNKQEILTGFQRTMPHSPPLDGNYGAYALDCEMVYTLGGIELARVTVIDMEGKTVFESLVKPFNPVVDFNTRFSGLTAADLKDVTTTGTDVQAILLSMFSDKTILIGHSLESDLFALKLIHSTVVDTSVVFPHRLGPPYKRALKNLMLETFQKIIQSDDGGHDSKEDAVACLDLMKWRIKEDSRRENRYS